VGLIISQNSDETFFLAMALSLPPRSSLSYRDLKWRMRTHINYISLSLSPGAGYDGICGQDEWQGPAQSKRDPCFCLWSPEK